MNVYGNREDGNGNETIEEKVFRACVFCCQLMNEPDEKKAVEKRLWALGFAAVPEEQEYLNSIREELKKTTPFDIAKNIRDGLKERGIEVRIPNEKSLQEREDNKREMAKRRREETDKKLIPPVTAVEAPKAEEVKPVNPDIQGNKNITRFLSKWTIGIKMVEAAEAAKARQAREARGN